MFGLGLPELLVILAILLLLFGTKRLKSLGSDLGSAIKGFRSAVGEEDRKAAQEQKKDSRVIEGEVNEPDSGTQQKTETKQDSNV